MLSLIILVATAASPDRAVFYLAGDAVERTASPCIRLWALAFRIDKRSQLSPASSAFAASNTASNIAGVSRPVFVFSREQW